MSVAKANIVNAWLPQGEPEAIPSAPQWFSQLQQRAQQDYQQTGLPGVRDEQWRYTNLRALKNADLSFATRGLSPVSPSPEHSIELVFINGFYHAELSNQAALPEGVVVTNLASALQQQSDGLEPIYGSTLPEQQHAFHLLNSAYATDGYVLIVPKGAVIEQPIVIRFEHTQGQASHTRNLILAGANSQCTVIERHTSQAAGYFSNSVTEVIAQDGSNIDHYKLHQESDTAFHIGGVFTNQARDSHISLHNIGLDGSLLRNDVIANLIGQGSHVEMNGLVIGKDKQHIDNHTEVIHAVANCTSDEYYKAILDDQSRSVFRGRIVVAQDAQKTNADQQNNNLLLSPKAEADTKPQLEIYADDVKCSHGATVGQLEQKSLFYLQSRGINKEQARALLTFAFANEVIERVKVDSVRAELTQLIAGELVSDLEGMV